MEVFNVNSLIINHKSYPMKQILKYLMGLALCFLTIEAQAQNIKIYPQTVLNPVSTLYKPSINFPPKTVNAQNDFVNNGIQYGSIRNILIESALEFAQPSIAGVMAQLEIYKPSIIYLNSRCDKLIMPILKLPLWLSSSTDKTVLGDPNWKKFNAVPPANYALWNILMDSIVNKINKQWGLNPYYEIWNEPDNFYWQGTPEQYFDFFKKTYFAVKTKHPTARIGGPTLSSFTSKFGSAYPVGFITNTQFNSSIMGRLIDSCVAWNAKLDFISWHKFDSFLYSTDMEIAFLNQKLTASRHGIVPYIVSEWNNTFQIRESNFAAAFMPNYVLALENHGVNGQTVAAMQDFDMGTTEFHNDYGMLSWGALHKPEWKSLLLLNKMVGKRVKTDSSNVLNLAVVSAIKNDTLRILFSNRALPAFTEAMSYLLYTKRFNENDIANAGYTVSKLDSIYKRLIKLSGTDSLSLAINATIPIYQKADTAFRFGRNIKMIISGIKGTHIGTQYILDSTQNNVIHQYDSLLRVGYSRATATAFLYPNSTIIGQKFTLIDSTYSFYLQPNAVAQFDIYIPNISSTANLIQNPPNFQIFPNPTSDNLSLVFSTQPKKGEEINVYNSVGAIVKTVFTDKLLTILDVSNLANGIYFIQLKSHSHQIEAVKFVKK
jgi:Glycosyl hydrolases family 39/Secretion system C-terminal sorting domain